MRYVGRFVSFAGMTLDDIRQMRQRGEHDAARVELAALARTHPDDALIQFETASVHDFLGREREAVPYYLAALRLGLPEREYRAAHVGLGSSYRTVGDYAAARRILEEGLARYPQAAEVRAFLAMTLYNQGDAQAAVAMLLELACDVSADPTLNDYERAIRFYAKNLDLCWD